jgi:polygalacturonase
MKNVRHFNQISKENSMATTNAVQKASDTTTVTHLADSQIIDNGTNVGIGTGAATIGAKLEVYGDVRICDNAGNKSIVVALPPLGSSQDDRQHIQDAIDSLPIDGGRVILQQGTYTVFKFPSLTYGLLLRDGV